MRRTAAACTLAAILIAGGMAPAERLQVVWHDNYETASAEARSLDRPILLYFTGKWCPSCLRVERTSFMDRRVVDFISGHLVAVRMDADASAELAETWKVDRLPTSLILSKDGKEQGRIEGYRPAANYLSELEAFTNAGQRNETLSELPSNVRPENQAQPAPRTAAQPTQDEPIQLATRSEKAPNGGNAIRLTLQQESNLAADGVCVVTMMQDHKIVPGDPQFSLEFDGVTYWFTGMPELEKFRADPMHYVPVLGGLCLTSLVDGGCEVQGSMRCAAVYRNRLYVFAGLEQRRRFQANPQRYADIAASSPKR